MTFQKMKRLGLTIFTVIAILGISVFIIAYGRGYRFNFQEKTLGSTGLFTAQSTPNGATIYIDGKKFGATNTNIAIKPGWYTVTLEKEGYQPWEKQIRVQGEVVAQADATLFPMNPSLSTLTTTGIAAPTLSPDGSKIAFIIPKNETTKSADEQTKTGVWVLNLIDLPLALNRDAKQILQNTTLPLGETTLTWSPNSKELLMTVTTGKNINTWYLLDAEKQNEFAKPMTRTIELEKEWEKIRMQKQTEQLATLKAPFTATASMAMRIVAFSPDENKILYEATAAATIPPVIIPALLGTNSTKEIRDIKPKITYVYDVKEDKNYELTGITADDLLWMPSSRHLMLAKNNVIQIFDFDGTNTKTVYSGTFWDSFAAPWTNGTKLVILTNLNPTASTLPNLYAVNIR